MNLLKEKITDRDTILLLIPQRDPIVMVDALLYYDETKVISGFAITENNIFVQEGVFTEAGLIENLAQTVAMYTGYQYYIQNTQAPEGYIGAIKDVHINRLPKVADCLETEVNILQEIMGVVLVKGHVKLGDEILLTAEMKTVLKK